MQARKCVLPKFDDDYLAGNGAKRIGGKLPPREKKILDSSILLYSITCSIISYAEEAPAGDTLPVRAFRLLQQSGRGLPRVPGVDGTLYDEMRKSGTIASQSQGFLGCVVWFGASNRTTRSASPLCVWSVWPS